MSWQSLAERVAKARGMKILKRMETAITGQAPYATIERTEDAIRVRGRGLKARWISEAGLRFALRAPSTSFAGPPPRPGEDLQ